jgi:DNA-directed RNA polymerase specialized sigma24 family protein
VQDLIVRHGPSVLDMDLPYLVTAARNQLFSTWRRTSREHTVSENEAAVAATSLWDPFERIALQENARELAFALAELADTDVMIVWLSADGYPDREIQERLAGRGDDITLESIRQRRHRAHEALHRRLSHRLRP